MSPTVSSNIVKSASDVITDCLEVMAEKELRAVGDLGWITDRAWRSGRRGRVDGVVSSGRRNPNRQNRC